MYKFMFAFLGQNIHALPGHAKRTNKTVFLPRKFFKTDMFYTIAYIMYIAQNSPSV